MVCSTCRLTRTPLPILLRSSATCSMTCLLTSVVPTVKKRGTLPAPSSRTRPVQRTFPLLILFIDLLSSKLETSQVVEVCIFSISQVTQSAHRLICSSYSGCPAPIVPPFPPTTHGQRRSSNLPRRRHLSRCRFPSLPPPRAYTTTPTLRLSSCVSGLMVVGHRLDATLCFPSFSTFSTVTPVTVPSHRTSSHSLHAHSPAAYVSNSAPGGVLLVRTSLSVVSLQSLSRSALNVSLSRYVAFVFPLLVCMVPSHGAMDMCTKRR